MTTTKTKPRAGYERYSFWATDESAAAIHLLLSRLSPRDIAYLLGPELEHLARDANFARRELVDSMAIDFKERAPCK